MIEYVLGGVGPEGLLGATPAGCLQWLDDTQLYAETFEQYADVLRKVLGNCRKWKVRLNAEKCDIIASEITWCGRVISGGTWRFSREYFDKILKIPVPENLEH